MATPKPPLMQDRSSIGAGDTRTIIAEWPLTAREHLRVSIDKYKGYDLISVRKWWFQVEDRELRPGKDGIAVQVKYLPQLVEAVIKALEIARERGLIEPALTSEQGDVAAAPVRGGK